MEDSFGVPFEVASRLPGIVIELPGFQQVWLKDRDGNRDLIDGVVGLIEDIISIGLLGLARQGMEKGREQDENGEQLFHGIKATPPCRRQQWEIGERPS